MQSRKVGVRAYSAGRTPRRAPHPLALELLKSYGHPTAHLTSKNFDAFAAPNAPQIDYVISVCGADANELCADWPNRPLCANWKIADPATAPGGHVARRAAFVRTYRQLEQQIDAFINSDFRPVYDVDEHARIEAQGRLELIAEMMWKPKQEDDEAAEDRRWTEEANMLRQGRSLH